MSLVITEKGGSNFDPIPAGIHQAICHAIYDIGTQYNTEYKKNQQKLIICFELPHERIEFEKDGVQVNAPRTTSRTLTASLNKKAALRKMLDSLRGRPFTAEELEGFDLGKVIGVNCQIQIIHEPAQNDPSKIYANIANVLPLGGGMKAMESEIGLVKFEIGDHLPDNTPEWIERKILTSEEMGGGQPNEEQPPIQDEAPQQREEFAGGSSDNMDSVPF